MSLISPASLRASWLSYLGMAVVFAAGSVALVAIGLWRIAAGGPVWLVLLLLGLSPLPAGLGWIGWRFAGQPARRRERVLRRIRAAGRDGVGTVVSMGGLRFRVHRRRGQTRFGWHEGFARRFCLRVETAARPGREVEVIDFIPPGCPEDRLGPGAQLPLLIDPEDPSEVAIHWDALFGRRWDLREPHDHR
jgi:hypothetical protein